MLETLRQAGRNLGRELGRSWENLSEGWREIVGRGSDALTQFTRYHEAPGIHPEGLARLPHWSLLAGEVEELEHELVVSLEVPGMEKGDFTISVEDNVLQVGGERHFAQESRHGTYHVMERAYGEFRRSIPLPRQVDAEHADASYRNGVLIIRLPKLVHANARNIPLS